MDNINLNLFEKDGAKMLEELGKGNMVVARSQKRVSVYLGFRW